MKKHETYQRACNNRDLHGFEGPIKVSFGNYTYPIMQDFLRAAESQGVPITDDLQDLKTGQVDTFEAVDFSFFPKKVAVLLLTSPVSASGVPRLVIRY